MVTVECRKCGHQHQTDVETVIKGLSCPSCHAHIILDDGSAITQYKIDDESDMADCPSCASKFPLSAGKHEPLLCCPSCKQIFLRKPLPDFTAYRSTWATPEILKVLESLYKQRLQQEENDQPLNNSGRILSLLNIKDGQDIGDKIYPLLQAIIHLAEKELTRLYVNLPMLPKEMRLEMCCRLASYPSLLLEFFHGRPLNAADAAPALKEVLKDDELYEQLLIPLNHRHFMLLSTYIMEFAVQRYGIKITRDMLNVISLAAKGQGLEEPICDSGYFVYMTDIGVVKSTTDLNSCGRREFYTKDDEVNRKLHKLCAKWGIRRRNYAKIIWFFILMILAMIILGIAFHALQVMQ